jgi:starch-binding outer membrane protein, SusD/RagB family
MKYFRIVILSLGLFAQSCDPLDVSPTNLIADPFKDEKGISSAVNGVYDALQSDFIARDLIIASELAADNLNPVGSKIEYREIFNNRITSFNLTIEGIWNAHYTAINRANNVLSNIQNASGIDAELKSKYEAQLLFIRALCHFNLLKSYGPVPIKTSPTLDITNEALYVGRSPETAVYAQIKQDLERAETLLSGTGKATSADVIGESAVLALHARVSLYEKNWSEVVSYTGKVMAFDYELVDGSLYQSLFVKNSENSEAIFQISFSDDDVNTLADYFLPKPNGRFEVAVTNSLANEYTSADLRKPVSALPTGSQFYSNKYTDFSTDSDHSIVLRYADILLMRAEALNELKYEANGEAFDLINVVRNRAGLNSLIGANAPSQEAFRLAIERERRLEFSSEGHRWYDLKRTGRGLAALGSSKAITSEKQLVFPIPQSEIDTNKHPEMVQNN